LRLAVAGTATRPAIGPLPATAVAVPATAKRRVRVLRCEGTTMPESAADRDVLRRLAADVAEAAA